MDRQQASTLLADTNILVVDDERVSRLVLTTMLESLGATVHRAKTLHEAIGLYLRLFKKRIIPRAVITDWWLQDRSSKAYEALATVDPENRHSTAIILLESIYDLDPDAFVMVYTTDNQTAQGVMDAHNWPAEVIDKGAMRPNEIAGHIACHDQIDRQRTITQPAVAQTIGDLLEPLCDSVESGGYLRMDTPTPGTLGTVD